MLELEGANPRFTCASAEHLWGRLGLWALPSVCAPRNCWLVAECLMESECVPRLCLCQAGGT